VEEQCEMLNMKNAIIIFFIFWVPLFSEPDLYYKLPYETPLTQINSYTSNLDNKNCTIQITYPILDPIDEKISQNSKNRLNKILRNKFFEARHFNDDVGCNSKFRKVDKAYYMEIKFEITMNFDSYVSMIYSAIGYPAGAKKTSITKRGLTLNLTEGYPILFSELFRKDSGFRKILDETLIEILLEKGTINEVVEFEIYKKKSYEFALTDKDLIILLEGKKEMRTLEVFIPYGRIKKILNKDIFID
jgi:hypothetical protein